MNKFMRLFAVLLVVAAVVLIVVSLKLGGKDSNPARTVTVSPDAATAPVEKSSRNTPAYTVVSAASSLAPGEPITADQLTTMQTPNQPVHGFASTDEVIGKIPAVSIAKGDAINRAVLLNDLSLKLHAGERAIAVSVDETVGVAHRIQPGDYVDVFFSMHHRQGDRSRSKDVTQSRLLLPRVRVLAYGARDLPVPATASSSKDKSSTNQGTSNARAAVLAVPVDKVNRLLLLRTGQSQAKLMLALRNPMDQGMPDPSLFAQPGPVLKAAAGTQRSTDGKKKLASADNHAYAGISLDGLAQGHIKPTPRATTARPRRARGHRVDVIRGTQQSHITVSQ